MNKRLTQDFFVGNKKTITSENREEVRQRVRSKGRRRYKYPGIFEDVYKTGKFIIK